ncbi:MAG: ABC transporter permease [Bryobacteraceae bacterium]|jgi:putative ABC transport system permease protein
MSWLNRLSNLWRGGKLSGELDEELEFHLEARTRDNIAAGMAPEAARLDARRRFGNRTLAKERTHEMEIVVADIAVSMETLGQDLRYALRSLRKSRGFTAVAILAMALGIGANTAVFTVVNGVLLRPLPFPEPGRLFLISYKPQRGGFDGPGLEDQHYLAFLRQNRAFERVATFGQDSVALTGAGSAVRVPAAMVTSSFFPVLRVNPAIGRAFSPEEERQGGAGVALIGDRIWRSRFGADPNILGKTIVLDGIGHTVIGIMPRGFAFPYDAELWLPLEVRDELAVCVSFHGRPEPCNSFFRPAVGRLRPSVSRQQAQAELEAFAQHLSGASSEDKSETIAEVLPFQDLLVGKIRKSLLIFMGAVVFVLLIACANVANLLLMRATSRRQEIAVRTALGARRSRLVRQLLTESTLVSLGGAAAGLLLAILGVPALLALAPAGRVPRMEEIHIDGWVLAFALGLGAFTGILFGLVPAFQATGRELRDYLSQSGRTVTSGREWLRSALVVAEIALALVLLTGAGLMLKSFLRMRAVNPGFRPENILTMTVDLPESSYPTTTAMQAFHTRTLTKLSNLPGVLSAGAVNWLPLGDALIRGDFHLEGGRRLPPGYIVDKPAVSPDYFHVIGIRLLSGRGFSDRDNSDAPGVALISEFVARTLWPNENPLGKRITLEEDPKPQDWLTVVGVVDDVNQQSLTEHRHPAIYQPYQQVRRPFFLSHMTFAVRTAANMQGLAAAMRRVLQEVDRNQPVESIAAMTDLLDATTAEPWFQARLISVFSILALLLSAIGIYGVLAYAVTERTREIGIRMALGAEKSDITHMVLRRSLLLAAAGVALGVAGALTVTRVLARFLFDVKPTDPATLAMVAAVLVTVALFAGLLPARRATRVDPLVALRWE